MTSSETDRMVRPGNADFPSAGRFTPGQLLAGRFTVIRYIAEGGMGEVYEVEDQFLQRVHVALKVIAPAVAGDARSSHRFEQEVLLARKVVHPNLCPIYDIARCDNPSPPFLFLTMKLLTGETLSARLKRAGKFQFEDAMAIFRQLVAGIAAIHAAGVIHRDIKPNNVMLDDSGAELCVSIMDFGLARLHEAETTMLTDSLGAGTPGYMAPELPIAGPSQAADIFALGVVLHQVLTGELPRYGAITRSVEPTPALDKADVPPLFIQAVRGFLSNDTNVRCQAFEQTKVALGTGSSAGQWAAQPAFPSRLRPVTRRQFAYGSALAACAAVGGIAWNWDRVEDLMHPLPTKRFVALLDWPIPTDPRVEPAVTAAVNAIGSELARAEAFDSNFYVIPHRIGKEVASLAQVNDVRESLGANLVLSASGVMVGGELQLLLRVLDPAASKVLRQKSIRALQDEQLSLPEKAVRAAASLLDLVKLDLADQRNNGGTRNPEAYAAFQRGEGFRTQPNDAGLDEAINSYRQAVDLDSHYALALAKLAIVYFRSYIVHRDPGALVSARANCEASLAQDPNLVEGHLALASVLDWTGDKPGSIREIAKALSIDPRNPDALLRQGQLLTRCNRWSDAEQTFARLQIVRPNFWLAHEELGVVYAYQGKFADAAGEFAAARKSAGKQTYPLVNLSAVALQTGDPDLALVYAGQSQALTLTDHGYVAMAAALRSKGRLAEALDCASKAAALNPDGAYNFAEIGDCYTLMKGHVPDMEKSFVTAAKLQNKVVQTNPTEGPTWMALALSQAKVGDIQSSSSSLITADKNYTSDLDSQLLKVRILELLHRHEEALRIASECLDHRATSYQFQIMPDIDVLRYDPRFQALFKNLSQKA